MSTWTCATHVVPELAGQGFYLAAPADADRLERAFSEAGYLVARATGTDDRAGTISAITSAVGVSKVGNYDAFSDVLSDVTTKTGRMVLFWLGSDALLEKDLPAWTTLADILRDASVEHWDPDNDDDPTNLVFETVAFIDGFGVKPLP